jgi:pyruvate formate lyase activating enzyme
MKGGLTVSGGEPLMQRHFVVKLLRGARAMGVHTTIETNGYLGGELGDDELDAIDLVMLGLKAWGEDRHRELTGREPGPTLDFARRLAARRQPIWVRFVLVPGLTDDPDEIAGIARFAAGLGNVERVEVLPFHQMGRYKWHKLGIKYHLDDVEAPSAEAVERACAAFRSEGLTAY